MFVGAGTVFECIGRCVRSTNAAGHTRLYHQQYAGGEGVAVAGGRAVGHVRSVSGAEAGIARTEGHGGGQISGIHELYTGDSAECQEQHTDGLADDHCACYIGEWEGRSVIGTSHHIFYFLFSCLQFEESFTAAHHSKIIPFTIAIFIKNYEDPFILQQLQEILQVLATNPASIGPLQEKLVPTLVSQKRACNATFPPLRLELNTIFPNISPTR